MTPPRPTPSLPPTEGSRAATLTDREALLAGDPAAIDAWYRSEHPAVFRLCLGLMAERSEADDAAQDAMLLLLDRLPTYDARRTWRSWRDTVVLNLCRDRLRRRTRQRQLAERAGEHRLPRELPDPHDEAAQREVSEILERALAHLTEREREAFVLRDLEGLPTPEAAEALGIGESSVRSLVTLARRRLRNLLSDRLPESLASPARPQGADHV